MGLGDEIMVTGEVKRRAAGTVRRFAIRSLKHHGKIIWSDIWAGNPRIARPGEPYDEALDNAGGHRPYIVAKGRVQWTWRAYRPEPGELFLTPDEKEFAKRAEGAILIQPGIKSVASPNKQWPLANWFAMIERAPNLKWIQIGDGSEPRLPVPFLKTPSFRAACGAVSGARSLVVQEGGLHHAAAALGKRAVVIFGGFIGPRVTGYDMHRNLFHDTKDYPLGCGMRVECLHCREAMKKFNPERVLSELKEMIHE